ncbi:hypothetical protein MMC25_004926 [Agyrium rufum]|nr:hypothetical protein [Agyrium rufum]
MPCTFSSLNVFTLEDLLIHERTQTDPTAHLIIPSSRCTLLLLPMGHSFYTGHSAPIPPLLDLSCQPYQLRDTHLPASFTDHQPTALLFVQTSPTRQRPEPRLAGCGDTKQVHKHSHSRGLSRDLSSFFQVESPPHQPKQRPLSLEASIKRRSSNLMKKGFYWRSRQSQGADVVVKDGKKIAESRKTVAGFPFRHILSRERVGEGEGGDVVDEEQAGGGGGGGEERKTGDQNESEKEKVGRAVRERLSRLQVDQSSEKSILLPSCDPTVGDPTLLTGGAAPNFSNHLASVNIPTSPPSPTKGLEGELSKAWSGLQDSSASSTKASQRMIVTATASKLSPVRASDCNKALPKPCLGSSDIHVRDFAQSGGNLHTPDLFTRNIRGLNPESGSLNQVISDFGSSTSAKQGEWQPKEQIRTLFLHTSPSKARISEQKVYDDETLEASSEGQRRVTQANVAFAPNSHLANRADRSTQVTPRKEARVAKHMTVTYKPPATRPFHSQSQSHTQQHHPHYHQPHHHQHSASRQGRPNKEKEIPISPTPTPSNSPTNSPIAENSALAAPPIPILAPAPILSQDTKRRSSRQRKKKSASQEVRKNETEFGTESREVSFAPSQSVAQRPPTPHSRLPSISPSSKTLDSSDPPPLPTPAQNLVSQQPAHYSPSTPTINRKAVSHPKYNSDLTGAPASYRPAALRPSTPTDQIIQSAVPTGAHTITVKSAVLATPQQSNLPSGNDSLTSSSFELLSLAQTSDTRGSTSSQSSEPAAEAKAENMNSSPGPAPSSPLPSVPEGNSPSPRSRRGSPLRMTVPSATKSTPASPSYLNPIENLPLLQPISYKHNDDSKARQQLDSPHTPKQVRAFSTPEMAEGVVAGQSPSRSWQMLSPRSSTPKARVQRTSPEPQRANTDPNNGLPGPTFAQSSSSAQAAKIDYPLAFMNPDTISQHDWKELDAMIPTVTEDEEDDSALDARLKRRSMSRKALKQKHVEREQVEKRKRQSLTLMSESSFDSIGDGRRSKPAESEKTPSSTTRENDVALPSKEAPQPEETDDPDASKVIILPTTKASTTSIPLHSIPPSPIPSLTFVRSATPSPPSFIQTNKASFPPSPPASRQQQYGPRPPTPSDLGADVASVVMRSPFRRSRSANAGNKIASIIVVAEQPLPDEVAVSELDPAATPRQHRRTRSATRMPSNHERNFTSIDHGSEGAPKRESVASTSDSIATSAISSSSIFQPAPLFSTPASLSTSLPSSMSAKERRAASFMTAPSNTGTDREGLLNLPAKAAPSTALGSRSTASPTFASHTNASVNFIDENNVHFANQVSVPRKIPNNGLKHQTSTTYSTYSQGNERYDFPTPRSSRQYYPVGGQDESRGNVPSGQPSRGNSIRRQSSLRTETSSVDTERADGYGSGSGDNHNRSRRTMEDRYRKLSRTVAEMEGRISGLERRNVWLEAAMFRRIMMDRTGGSGGGMGEGDGERGYWDDEAVLGQDDDCGDEGEFGEGSG